MSRLQHRAGSRTGHRARARSWQQLPLVAAALLFAAPSSAQETSVNAASKDLSAPAADSSGDDREHVLLQEVMPALSGTPEGAVQVARAPAPGSSMTINRADVQRALAQAGMRESLKAKDIPKSVKISRESVTLTREDLSAQATESVRSAVSPCVLGDVRYPSELRVQSGPRSFRADFNGLRSGSNTGAVFIETSGRELRVPVIASLTCPPPDISAGTQVVAVAQVGSVKASAPAEARQAGRIGEIIRVTNRATGASLRARIVNAHTVEVLP